MERFDYEKIKSFIRSTSKHTSIYVGCDSRQTAGSTLFVIVIVVHIDSNRGAKVFFEVRKERKITSLRERLMREVDYAVLTALNIVDAVENRPFEVHLDINPDENFRSSIVVKEAIGYVKAQGLKPVLKPYSIAAYAVADYITNKY